MTEMLAGNRKRVGATSGRAVSSCSRHTARPEVAPYLSLQQASAAFANFSVSHPIQNLSIKFAQV